MKISFRLSKSQMPTDLYARIHQSGNKSRCVRSFADRGLARKDCYEQLLRKVVETSDRDQDSESTHLRIADQTALAKGVSQYSTLLVVPKVRVLELLVEIGWEQYQADVKTPSSSAVAHANQIESSTPVVQVATVEPPQVNVFAIKTERNASDIDVSALCNDIMNQFS